MTVVEHSSLVETKWARLGDVADINPKWNPLAAKEDSVSFVGMAQMSDVLGCVTDEEQRRVQEVRTGYTAFERGDLLVAKITPCFENGKIGQANITNKWGAGSTEFHVVRPGDRLDAGYTLHFLRRQQFRTSGKLRMTGSGGQQRVPASYVADTKIPLPPLPEQRRIAAILDKSDDLRTQRREALAHLDALTQSMFVSVFGTPIAGWTLHPIVQIGDVLLSATYGSSEKASLEGATPVLRMNNITYSGGLDLTNLKYMPEDQPEKHLVRDGDLLFNRTNSKELVGKTCVYRGSEVMAYAGYLVRLRLSDQMTPDYLNTFMNLAQTKQLLRNMCKSIVGMANINAKEVQKIRIPLPPLELQQTFATRVAAVERLKEKHRAQLAELDTLFASLQHRAFRGEL